MYAKVIHSIETAFLQQQFIKLICGASFTDIHKLEKLVLAYIDSGINCIDVACDLLVIDCISALLKRHHKEKEIALMVSFALDDDPHFRKIELNEKTCIDCGLCIPVCPTTVFDQDLNQKLLLDAPKCYGCARCIPICPTEALSLSPFSHYQGLPEALAHPMVSAVEIHSSFTDSQLLTILFNEMGSLLKDKKIALCFRPQLFPQTQSAQFIETAASFSKRPIIIQVDGEPMSATEEEASGLPALKAAANFYELNTAFFQHHHLMISGGINGHTAKFLKRPAYQMIEGVGLGTAAKLAVWPQLNHPQQATESAKNLISRFLQPQIAVFN